jgi:hypothetical protein
MDFKKNRTDLHQNIRISDPSALTQLLLINRFKEN